jgi:flavin-binding protein dodecin
MQREHRWPTGHRPDDDAVGVQKAIDLIGTGDSIQDAVTEALEVQRISGAVDGAAAAYEVQLRVWFTLLERMHG